MAITNDTQFLSSHLVMDYSLLVGMDENTKELVVGIIGRLYGIYKVEWEMFNNNLLLLQKGK